MIVSESMYLHDSQMEVGHFRSYVHALEIITFDSVYLCDSSMELGPCVKNYYIRVSLPKRQKNGVGPFRGFGLFEEKSQRSNEMVPITIYIFCKNIHLSDSNVQNWREERRSQMIYLAKLPIILTETSALVQKPVGCNSSISHGTCSKRDLAPLF